MLAPLGLDQAVEGIVGVVATGLDALVAEKNHLLRIVADVGDVAGRIVGVAQVLQYGAGSLTDLLQRPVDLASTRIQNQHAIPRLGLLVWSAARQAIGLGSYSYPVTDTVAVFDPGALGLGVVVDIADKGVIRPVRIEQPLRLLRPLHPGIDPLQQVGLVVAGRKMLSLTPFSSLCGATIWMARLRAS